MTTATADFTRGRVRRITRVREILDVAGILRKVGA
jgi:hypothetical protein